jgi:gamma-glutamyl-gamma-aminobutyrate hydrolase PuuD
VVEAVELPTHSWVVGVQWHPEAHAGESLFDAFVARCAQRVAAVPDGGA